MTTDSTAFITPTSTDLTEHITARYPTTVAALRSIIRHPRSLARATAAWRPPLKTLPRIGHGEELTVAVIRRRVGPRARARIQGFGEENVPAYLIELRITSRTGLSADPVITEAWIRALLPGKQVAAVHEISSPRAINYVWLADFSYTPVKSPPSLFEGITPAQPQAS
ncbi:hypothetical protein [Corynebacterium mayonis]|uniref:hypothetical protein n=1 Tax=Corynebacterium mayonis TaxID=3062461 RepID=UPI00313FFE8E